MNISTLHPSDKGVSAQLLFKGEAATTNALHLSAGEQLKEHTTKVPALLVCVIGEVVFNNVKGIKETLHPGDYIHIETDVVHWLDALKKSELLLIK